MQHFAEIDEENRVLRVIVIGDKDCTDEEGNISESVGSLFCNRITDSEPFTKTSRWVLTFTDNNNFLNRKNFAGKNDIYDEARNAFYPDKSHEDWIFSEEKCMWIPPVPHPDDGLVYTWLQSETRWVRL